MKTSIMLKAVILIMVLIFPAFATSAVDNKSLGQGFRKLQQERSDGAQTLRDWVKDRLIKPESKEIQFKSGSAGLMENRKKTLQGSAFLADGDTGSISGTIRDTAGTPAGGVSVQAYDRNRHVIGDYYFWSDSEGHYVLNELPTGDYYVGAFYRLETGPIWYQGRTPYEDDPPPVHVDAPNATQNIDFILEEGGTLSGRILDQSGNPLEGIGVDVCNQYYSNPLFHYCCSDAEGSYKINCIPTGNYFVKTWSETCYVDEWYEDTAPGGSELGPVHVDVSNETADIDFSLALGGAISGRVVLDPGSEGLEGTHVSIYGNVWGTETAGYTDANGYYSLCGLATGNYCVGVGGHYDQCVFGQWYQDVEPVSIDYAPVHVDAPGETTNINFNIEGWGSISGSILNSMGIPIEGIQIGVYDSPDNAYYAESDSQGHYTVNCIAPGGYYISINGQCYLEKWYQNAIPRGSNPPPVHVNALNETPNIDFTVEELGRVSGRIVDQIGNPIEGAEVQVRDGSGLRKYGSTNSEGYYSVCGLITGNYYVGALHCNSDVLWYQDALPTEGDPPPVLVVAPNETQNIDFTLEEGGSISGRILDPTGTPSRESIVYVYDSNGSPINYAEPDTEGYYIVNCLPTGNYYIRAIEDYNQCYLYKWYRDADPHVVDPPPPPVHVDVPHRISNINFTMDEGGSISGRILDTAGIPIEGVRVESYNSNESWMVSSAFSDSEGYYTINCLITGDYYICTDANYQGYLDTCYQGAMPGSSDAPPVHVEIPNETPNIDFILEKGGTVSGRILDSTGVPLEGIDVYLYESNGNWMSNRYSDSEGCYIVNGLPTGDYYICVFNANCVGYLDTCYQNVMPGSSDPPPIHVDAPNETPNIDFTLIKGGSISGRIIDQYGNPIKPEVYVYDDEGNIISWYNLPDSDGNYSIQGLPSGDYYVRISGGGSGQCYLEKWYGDVNGLGCGDPPVHVDAPNETSGINFVIEVPDSDNDGIDNCRDNCPTLPNGPYSGTCLGEENAGGLCDDASACPNGQCIMDQTDSDWDGLGDVCDNCPYDSNGLSPLQKYQEDIDHDGIGDVCDPDNDNDAIPNEEDACPLDPDNDIDKDGYCSNVDNCPDVSNPDQADTDLDGAGDSCDSCPSLYNPAQDDMDHDGSGDSCDNDLDGDGLISGNDNCPSVYNTTQEDSDRDGFGDICDSENNFAVLDLAANKVVVFDLSARMISEKKFDGMGTAYFIAPSINGWLVKGCPTSGCAMSNWIIWDLNPDLSVRNTITNQKPAHLYAPLSSGNFVSGNVYTGAIDLYDTSGAIIKSINVWEEEDGWPYEYKKMGDLAALVNGGFVVTPEGGYPVDGEPFTPFLYFYDNNLTLINKVNISGEKIHLFYLTGLDNGSFAATCRDCGTNNNNVDSICFFSPEGELVNRINIIGDITGSLYLMDVFLTGLKGGGVMVSTKGSDKVWIYHSPPQELDLSGSGITNIGALAGNIFPTQFSYILVSGSVRDLVSGAPIDGADIRTNGIGQDISRNGEYIFSEVQGKWTISARAEGYAYYASTLNMDTEDEYVLKNITMHPLATPECRTGSDCDDGLYCTGTETCVSGSCAHAGNPCASHLLCIEETDQCVEKGCNGDTDCNDGQFCNGEEVCAGGICQAGVYPCAEPTPQCDEASDRCTEGPSITLFPNPYLQSRWMPMLLLLRIVGTETHFDGSSRVTFNPENGIMAIPLLGDRRHIFMIGLLLPGWLSPAQSIAVTVTTGSETVSDTLNLNSLPFMLDEQGEMLKEVTP